MRRKVIKQGPATLMVSLPSKWVKENKISPGDEMAVLPSGNRIIFSKTEHKSGRKEITVNVDDFCIHFALSRFLAVLYKTNYDKITIVYTKPVYLERAKEKIPLKVSVQDIVKRFVGAEITSQTSNKIDIECFATEENPDLDKISKRIYFLMRETLNDMLLSIGKDYRKFHETIYLHHDNITKFINYFERTLYGSDKSEDEKKSAFAFYSLLGIAVDKMRHISYKIDRFGCTPKAKKYLEDIFKVFYEQFEYSEEKHAPQELIRKRYMLRQKIINESFNIKEYQIISDAMLFLDTIINFSEYVIAKNLEKGQNIN